MQDRSKLHGVLLIRDVAQGKMYWVSSWFTDSFHYTIAGKVQRANLDGSGVEDLALGLEVPTGLAVDKALGKVYWMHYSNGSDTRMGKIQRSNLDGSDAEDFITNLKIPTSLTFLPGK